jgi:hypothetical protein
MPKKPQYACDYKTQCPQCKQVIWLVKPPVACRVSCDCGKMYDVKEENFKNA